MAQDYVLETRRALLPALKSFGPLTDLIPASSIYPATVPKDRTFPFIRCGSFIVSPFRASGLDSSSIRASFQAFTKGGLIDQKRIVSAEDHAYLAGSAMKDALDGRTIAISLSATASVTWIQSLPMRDGDEADAWMTTVTFGVEVAG